MHSALSNSFARHDDSMSRGYPTTQPLSIKVGMVCQVRIHRHGFNNVKIVYIGNRYTIAVLLDGYIKDKWAGTVNEFHFVSRNTNFYSM